MREDAIIIRPVEAADRATWLDLWAQYCAFYGADVPARVTDATWNRITTPGGPVSGLVAVNVQSQVVAGFANYVVHPFTWSERNACYLEDLFVRPELRGTGMARALIERLVTLGNGLGWSRIYWTTQESNVVARRLYDRFVPADDVVRYTISLDDVPTPKFATG